MNRPSRHGGALRALPIALAAVLLIGVGLPAAGRAQDTVGAEAYCYGWGFLNNSGQDADDLHVLLQGVRDITTVYQGLDNPFGAALPTSGYDAGLGAYRLDFGDGTALNGVSTHIGACTGQPMLRLAAGGATPPFYWTAGGAQLQPDPLFLGVSWGGSPRSGLTITLHNDTAQTLVLWSLDLLAAEAPLPLDDLGEVALATLPGIAQLAPDVVTLAPSTSQSFAVSAAELAQAPSGGALVLQGMFSTEEDVGDTGAVYAQLFLPGPIYLPLIQR